MSVCPDCYSELISEYKYPYKGEIYVSRYCVSCDRWIPKPLLLASKWNPKVGDYKE